MAHKIFLVAIPLFLFGCGSILPSKRTESIRATEAIANQQQFTVERVFRSEPVPTNNIVETRTTMTSKASTTAGAKESAKASVSLPLAVSILMSAIAFVLVAVVWVMASKLSAAFGAADKTLGTIGDSVDNVIAQVSDPATKVLVASLKSSVEKQRGKLSARKI